MMTYLAIAVGGALGAMSRFALIVNVSGSLLIGVLYVLISEKMLLSVEARALLIVGFLGAFTTFSTFSLDTLLLIQQGFWLQACAYLMSSVLICVLATWLGMALTRLLA